MLESETGGGGVRVGPWSRIVFCSVVLVGHNCHLVEVNLRDIGVWIGGDVFFWDNGEDNRFGGRGTGCCNNA